MTQQVRVKIDDILRSCATIYSNLGTKTPFDVGSKSEARRIEKDLLEKIKNLDEESYNTITNHDYQTDKEEALEQ